MARPSLFDQPARPVLSEERLMDLCAQILDMTTADDAVVYVEHAARSFTRLANGQVLTLNDGDTITIRLDRGGATLQTDQVDLDTLRALVRQWETAVREPGEMNEVVLANDDHQDTYLPVALWHDSTVEAMTTSRQTLLPSLLRPIAQHGLVASGYVGFLARAQGMMRKARQIHSYYEETDVDLSVTARTADNLSSGWGGQADRRWEAMDPGAVTARAIDLAQRGVNPKAIEPGWRTVILTREAVAQIVRYFGVFCDAIQTESMNNTPFWRPGVPSNRVGQKVFDAQISMRSDPADPDGGFAPFFFGAYATPAMVWVDQGVLKNLAFMNVFDAVTRRKPYAADPVSLRMAGGSTTIEQMIARCDEGILVNHFHNVDVIDPKTGLMTGTTRDGCFWIQNGKIETAAKNFRFVDSPMFMFNNVVAMGESKRAAYGYTPVTYYEIWSYDGQWPRPPMIVPPMMIRDFHFTSLAEPV